MRTLDWNLLRAFHMTATAGSLSAAARQTGLTQPTLSRQVSALEAELGIALFDRIGRKLVLTLAGADLLAYSRSMGEAAEAMALAASGRVQEIGGRVSLSATDSYAAYILPDIVARIRAAAPQITIMVVASNALSDLHRREADIAIRHVKPDRPGLVGQHICDTEAHFYASDDWIARNGMPAGPADLARGDLICFEDAAHFADFMKGIGIPVDAADFRLASDSAVAIWEMVRRGLGIGGMLREVADRTPGVRRVAPDLPPIPVPVWLVTHRELEQSPRIRLVQAILAEELSRLPERRPAAGH
ncbi:LysR family transcriptional regulator [Phreatobacter sp.]|uniref:LysR family transcriptional regulator n=1 Tax=Phreatobacter sp. TaxID=1966341 RepID=UPI003F730D75